MSLVSDPVSGTSFPLECFGPDIEISLDTSIIFLVLLWTGFHVLARRLVSSRVFSLLGRFSILMASLIVLLILMFDVDYDFRTIENDGVRRCCYMWRQ